MGIVSNPNSNEGVAWGQVGNIRSIPGYDTNFLRTKTFWIARGVGRGLTGGKGVCRVTLRIRFTEIPDESLLKLSQINNPLSILK